ncbi:DNA-processing protein DprA [Cohnella sp.]|uniref:DNA-processing protein DprA n=1 Tax=Cohnella sp. TaxID=1883426 RepID=UPI003567BB31
MGIPIKDVLETKISPNTFLALHETDGVGTLTIKKIVNYGIKEGNAALRQAESFREGDWREIGLSVKQAAAIVEGLRPDVVYERIQKYANRGISYMTYIDRTYPALLREIADPPWVLYYKGNCELALHPAIAMVGTRLATSYGRKAAEEIAAGCAERMTVVSGLARGIDTAAHLGALNKPCGTIAVLGAPVNYCYPPENKALFRDIEKKGLLISETVPDTPLRPGLFPLRNRIIAGLSHGVIVVEAAERSGALITADLAIGYERDVFVVPGPITSPRSEGALKYYRKGATPVLDESDIFRAYSHILPEIPAPKRSYNGQIDHRLQAISLSEDETLIYNFLLDQHRTINELSIESGMTFGLLHSVLLSLLIKRRIHQQPGSVYTVL